MPLLLPTYHFYFYAKGALTVFAGVAAWAIFTWAWRRLDRSANRGQLSLMNRPVTVFFALVAVACTLNYPAYATRRDVFWVRNRNLAFMKNTDGMEAAVRMNALLPWNAVVLCEERLSIWPTLATARHLVSTTPSMGNPYMDQSGRQADNALLLQGMGAPRTDTKALLDKYGVTHLFIRPDDLTTLPEARRWFPTEVFRNNSYLLLAR